MKFRIARIAAVTAASMSLVVTLIGPVMDPSSPSASAAAAGSTVELTVAGRSGIAGDASAVVLNLTAVDAYVTAWPCGETRPLASNLNFVPNRAVANSAIVGVGSDGKVCLYTASSTELVVDVNGWFPAGADYQTMTPARLLDTRSGGQLCGGFHGECGSRSFRHRDLPPWQ